MYRGTIKCVFRYLGWLALIISPIIAVEFYKATDYPWGVYYLLFVGNVLIIAKLLIYGYGNDY